MRVVFIVFFCLIVFQEAIICQPGGLSYDEINRRADLVFTGTAIAQQCFFQDDSLIITESTFDEVIIIGDTSAMHKDGSIIRLVYAGGTLDGKTFHVCDMPEIIVGKRYLLFTCSACNGGPYPNPFPGGCYAVIEIFRYSDNTENIALQPSCSRDASVISNPD